MCTAEGAARLEPGGGDAVVCVLGRNARPLQHDGAPGRVALLLGVQAVQQAHDARHQRLVALVAAADDAQQQRHQAQQHPQVALLQQRAQRGAAV